MTVKENELIKLFNDVVVDEDGHKWSQVCDKHKDELYLANDGWFSYAPDCGTCGIASCSNESNHYIDF